jgi:hypothetical protein
MLWKREKSCIAGNQTWVIQPIACRYTDCFSKEEESINIFGGMEGYSCGLHKISCPACHQLNAPFVEYMHKKI